MQQLSYSVDVTVHQEPRSEPGPELQPGAKAKAPTPTMSKKPSMKQRIRNSRFTRMALGIIRSAKWLSYYLKHSATLSSGYVPQHSRAWIMKEAHTIEKGLSFRAVRPHFGAAKRERLLKELECSRIANANEEPRSVAMGVLGAYLAWHEDNGQMNEEMDELARFIGALGTTPTRLGGTVPYRPDYAPEKTALYDSIVTSRRSVRNFKPDPVPLGVIRDAVRVANHSPSVCNRQSWAVVLVQDREIVRQMLDLQNGNKGFDETIGNMIVVLADVRGFLDEYEMFEPFVDAGIFSGALVNALNAHNVGSCCLNLCVSHHMALKIAQVLDVEPGMFPVMMIACGYAEDDCRVAISTRLDPTVLLR